MQTRYSFINTMLAIVNLIKYDKLNFTLRKEHERVATEATTKTNAFENQSTGQSIA